MQHSFTDRIGIIGTGNVAWHLATLLSAAHIPVSGVLVRNKKKAAIKGLGKLFGVTLLDEVVMIKDSSDIVIIAVNDSSIREVAGQFKDFNGLVCHTSGSFALSEISDICQDTGVFYPLQTLTKGRFLPSSEIPVFIEASSRSSENRLMQLGMVAGFPVSLADSHQRALLHIAAVFASNFANHLWVRAKELLEQQGFGFTTLLPLIRETCRKAATMDPAEAQTGPASRGDLFTLTKHMSLLEDDPNLQEIYRLISDAIILHHHKPER